MKNDGLNKNYNIKKQNVPNCDALFNGIIKRDIAALSRGITLIESSNPEHNKESEKLIDKCLPLSGNSIRIGITGTPGVGKSTFIESFGNHLSKENKRIAVLAIDPSSNKSGGSILGDKTRMENLVLNNNVFIRPSPSKGSLGGVARRTRESIILCEAAGYDVILIETVGVGQSEISVKSMVDFFLLLMQPGGGDELQGIKRGIMEMADTIVITKADGENLNAARRAKSDFTNALHLFPPNLNNWIPKVHTCSAIENNGISEVWKTIESFINHCSLNGFLRGNRISQSEFWMKETILAELGQRFFNNEVIKKQYEAVYQEVVSGKISPFKAANMLLSLFIQRTEA